MPDNPEKCPECYKLPKVWKERLQYGSRELWWFGCHAHPINLEGGVTRWVAMANWNRRIHRWKFEHRTA